MNSPASSVARSLKRKLLLPLLLIGAVVATATVWGIYANSQRQLAEKLRRRGELIANSVNYAAESMSRTGELQRFVAAIGAEEEVSLIVVVGGRPARVLATTRSAWLGKALTELPAKDVAEDLKEAIQTRRSHHHLHIETAQSDFTSPLFLSQPELADRSLIDGAVMVHLDLRPTQAAVRQMAIEFSVAFLAVLGIFAALGYVLLRRVVLRPIARIGELIERRREGARESWAEADTGDEIGALVRTLNESLTSTDAAIRELEEQGKALRQAESKYRSIFDNAAEGIFQTTPEGKFLMANPATASILGFASPEELIRVRTDVVGQGYVHPEQREEFKRLVEQQGTVSGFEYEVLRNDGRVVWLSETAWAVRDPAGRIVCYEGILKDITERKRAEQERATLEGRIQQAQKMESVGQLAGGVAHDFNNMLGVILGHTELVIEQIDPADPLHDDLAEIRQAAIRSANLTRQLLAFARKQAAVPKVLDLNDTVAAMLNMLRRLIGEGIDLTWQPGADLFPLKVDPSQIDQILANLCVNARDAISGVGKVIVATANSTLDAEYCAYARCAPGQYVRLTVSDDGCGMDEETLSHVFEPFFTTKSAGQGTGLGLSTVYGIVSQNNGFIDVSSRPDRGTTFTVYLPRHVGEAAQPRAEGTTRPDRPGHETILLVEDERTVLKLTKRMLEHEGYTVLAAGTPGEAISLAREHAAEISLLITDVIMPEMNGSALARSIIAIRPHIKCLFMSGYTADVIAHDGVVNEGAHFIQKPVSKQDLAAKVRGMLRSDA